MACQSPTGALVNCWLVCSPSELHSVLVNYRDCRSVHCVANEVLLTMLMSTCADMRHRNSVRSQLLQEYTCFSWPKQMVLPCAAVPETPGCFEEPGENGTTNVRAASVFTWVCEQGECGVYTPLFSQYDLANPHDE